MTSKEELLESVRRNKAREHAAREDKRAIREQLEAHVREFLAKGKCITELDTGMQAQDHNKQWSSNNSLHGGTQ